MGADRMSVMKLLFCFALFAAILAPAIIAQDADRDAGPAVEQDGGSPDIQLQSSQDTQDDRSGRRYDLNNLGELRHRPPVNTHLFPQLAINPDLEWIRPHPQNHPDHHHHNQGHIPDPHHPHHPHRPPSTVTHMHTITHGPTVFWTDFIPFCSLDPLPPKCSVRGTTATVTTTDVSHVLHVYEDTYTYTNADCLSVVQSTVTDTATIDRTTSSTFFTTVTASVTNSLTTSTTVIVPSLTVTTSTTTTTLYEYSSDPVDCYDYVSTTTLPYPGPTSITTLVQSSTDTDTFVYDDLATCSFAETVTEPLEPTLTLDVLAYELAATITTVTLPVDQRCSDQLYVITETAEATTTVFLVEGTLVSEVSTRTGNPDFVCPDTVTVTTTPTPALEQSTTTLRLPIVTLWQTLTETTYTLQPNFACGGVLSTSTELHTTVTTSTRVATVALTSTAVVGDSACARVTSLPNHGCPSEFLLAVRLVIVEMAEILDELRHLLSEMLPHLDGPRLELVERFNRLPLREILEHLPLAEQRDEAMWSQRQLTELREMLIAAKESREYPSRLFDKVNLVVARMERIRRSLGARM